MEGGAPEAEAVVVGSNLERVLEVEAVCCSVLERGSEALALLRKDMYEASSDMVRVLWVEGWICGG